MGKIKIEEDAVQLCRDRLPVGVVEFVRRKILPQDKVLIYKKGNRRGLCCLCGHEVRALDERFLANARVRCPDCGEKVDCVYENSGKNQLHYVTNIIVPEKGTDGKTLFLRQFRLNRDRSAVWADIPGFLKEVARYALRDGVCAKWVREDKHVWGYGNLVLRETRKDWYLRNDTCRLYDVSTLGYEMYIPAYWPDIVEGTALRYCPVDEFCRKIANPARALTEWVKYPAIEKLYKAGYEEMISNKSSFPKKKTMYAVSWNATKWERIWKIPNRLLKLTDKKTCTLEDVRWINELWGLVKEGLFTEKDLQDAMRLPRNIDYVLRALEHATPGKVVRYLEKTLREWPGDELYHGYKERDVRTSYRDYLQECVVLGMNLDDKQILFPPDLNAAHERTMTQVRYKMDEEKKKQFKKAAANLRQYCFEWDGLLIRPANTPTELTKEAETLHHCVGGYAERMAKGETAIFFIRRCEEPNKPFYTLELQDKDVIQCRTEYNASYAKDPAVKAFVKEWLAVKVRKTKKERATDTVV